MNILIIGASGYLGRALTLKLHTKDNTLYLLGRDKNKTYEVFKRILSSFVPFPKILDYKDELPDADIVINLAGESIAAKILTKKRIKTLESSRLDVLAHIENKLKKYSCKSRILLQASALGIYEDNSSNIGNDELALICKTVEDKALSLNNIFSRIVALRLGIILGKESPFIQKINKIPPIKFIGKEKHIGWISIEDTVNAIIFIINNNKITENCNLTAPYAASRNELMNLRSASILPALPILSWCLNFGDKRGLLLNKEQYVTPNTLLDHGFIFTFKTLSELKKHL